ncbi:MAG TPA: hypothetical protein VMM78_08805 [Thermomicrobiales bacterium]|nr:hypothetical protein [Thermomicrobiales bacterium]
MEDACGRIFPRPSCLDQRETAPGTRGGFVSQALLLAIMYVGLCLPLIGYAYGRQRRWLGAAGWALLMGGLLLAFGGGGDLFAWAGLLWSSLAAFGGLMVVMDVAEARRRRG